MTEKYHGKPCKRCGNTERYNSNRSCTACAAGRGRYDRDVARRKRMATPEYKRKAAAYARARYIKATPKTPKVLGPWCKAHSSNMRRARDAGAIDVNMTREHKELIRRVYQRCYELNEQWGTDFVVDHVRPLNKGGKHEWSNLQLLDGAINYRKRDKYPWSYSVRVVNGAVLERHEC